MKPPIRQEALGEQKRAEKNLTLFRQVGTLDDMIDFEHSSKRLTAIFSITGYSWE